METAHCGHRSRSSMNVVPGTGLYRYAGIGVNPSAAYRRCASRMEGKGFALRRHRRAKGVQQHACVSQPACLADDALGQGTADALTPAVGADVEPFHFTDVLRKLPQRHAADTYPVLCGHQERPIWRTISALEGRDLVLQVLEAE